MRKKRTLLPGTCKQAIAGLFLIAVLTLLVLGGVQSFVSSNVGQGGAPTTLVTPAGDRDGSPHPFLVTPAGDRDGSPLASSASDRDYGQGSESW